MTTPSPGDVQFRDVVVFTRDGAGGNPLAVIEFGEVPANLWQRTAAAIGYSETVFVEPGDTAVVHIYTPARRIPFAGHPLVGTAAVLGRHTTSIRYDVGTARVDHDADMPRITVTSDGDVRSAAPPEFGVAAWIVEMPLPYLVVEAADIDVVARLDAQAVAGLGEVYVWAWEVPDEVVRSRFFAPGVGVEEDAATGSAAVALARTRSEEEGRVVIHQGEEMGRPSQIQLAWSGTEVSIGGHVSDLGLGSVRLD